MIGRLVECKHSGNLGIVVDRRWEYNEEHYLVQFETMKVWLRFCAVDVIKCK